MATYIQIGSTVTVGSGGAASIDFTSIPATYTDLVVKFSLRQNNTSSSVGYNWLGTRFNGSTATYTGRLLYAASNTVGSASFSDTQFRQYGFDNNSWTSGTANTFSNGEIYIPNYTSATNKSISVDSVAEINAANGSGLGIFAGLWPVSSAITSISIYDLDAYNFVQYSTATLYGILKN